MYIGPLVVHIFGWGTAIVVVVLSLLKTQETLKSNSSCHHHIENTTKGEEQFLTLSNFLRQNQISALFFRSRLFCSRRQQQIQNSFEKRNKVPVDLSKILLQTPSLVGFFFPMGSLDV
jgi:hypothetical protein